MSDSVFAPRAIALMLAGACLLTMPACRQANESRLQDGDLIFHTSTSRQSLCLQRLMNSPYSHMGVIYIENGEPFVYEAIQPVQLTPLQEWVDRGRDGRYVVKRLRNASSVLTPEALAAMKREGSKFAGKGYDLRFGWTDDLIYCSELVWKIYDRGASIQIGELQRFADFDLSDPRCVDLIRARFPNFPDDVNPDEEVISPAQMFASDLLVQVR